MVTIARASTKKRKPVTDATKPAASERGSAEMRANVDVVHQLLRLGELGSFRRRPPLSSMVAPNARGRPATELSWPHIDGQRSPQGGTTMAHHQNIAEWHGKTLVDREGQKIGKLQDVYVDVETDEPMFGTVKEGLISRHLTFVPLAGLTFGPDALQMAVTREQVKSAPNIELQGDELSRADESALYHHYELNYTPPDTESGRRLARR
jgi:PRC-barrel domain